MAVEVKRVMQTRFGRPHGNCFAACVASILELPLDAVDFVVASDNAAEWFSAAHLALAKVGAFRFTFAGPKENPAAGAWNPPADFACIATVLNPQGELHCVIFENGKVAHDPNPSQACVALTLDDVLGWNILVPINSAAWNATRDQIRLAS